MAKLKFPSNEEFEDLLTKAGILPNTQPDPSIEEKCEQGIHNVFDKTLSSDQLKMMIEEYLFDHMVSAAHVKDGQSKQIDAVRVFAKQMTESILVLYSQAILVGMLMFEDMVEKGVEED